MCSIIYRKSKSLACSVLEVYRPDEWSVSTLLVVHKQGATYYAIEKSIKALITSLISSGCHWANDSLLEDRGWIGKVKHIGSQTSQDVGAHFN